MNLTKEAKIHLATEVDSMTINRNKTILSRGCFGEIELKDYNPHNPDSPYAMKYLRDLWKGLAGEQKYAVVRESKLLFSDMFITIDTLLFHTSIIVENILKVTGFEGTIWEGE